MKLKVQIASVPDRDNLVAEIWVGDQQLAEVSQETGTLKIEIYQRTGEARGIWEIEFDELVNALQEARNKLRANETLQE